MACVYPVPCQILQSLIKGQKVLISLSPRLVSILQVYRWECRKWFPYMKGVIVFDVKLGRTKFHDSALIRGDIVICNDTIDAPYRIDRWNS
jgi:hypothetical protein